MNSIDFSTDWQFAYAQSEQWSNHYIKLDYSPVNLPHDFRIGLERNENSLSGTSEGYYPGGVGYYRKTFLADKEMLSQRVLLFFDGVYRMCEVRLNNNIVAVHKGGYTGFFADLTDRLSEGENIISVKVNATMLPASRWYTGAGIYRKVTMYTGSIPSIEPWGTAIETLPETLTSQNVDIRIKSNIYNPDNISCNVRYEIIDPEGNIAAESCLESVGSEAETIISIPNPRLWDADTPYLYTLKTTVEAEGITATPSYTRFGIRTIKVDAENGLLINGRKVLLKGGCIHHDNGLLGSAAYPAAERRRIMKLKENGYNAIRCSHNPPSTVLLDACDELGMYVIDEAFDSWREGKRLNDEHIFFELLWKEELHSMIMRDRNHPSIIMWSTGNEVMERSGLSDGAAWSKKLADAVRELDKSRPVTNALCGFYEDVILVDIEANTRSTAGEGKDYWANRSEKFCEPLDVVGYNYLLDRYEKDHELYPDRVIIGTESFPWKSFDYWDAVEKYPYVIGDFVWTAWDYFGESGLGHTSFEGEAGGLKEYPWHIANCGDFDICGRKRPQSHYRDFIWTDRKQPYIAVQHPMYFGKEEKVSAWGWPDVTESWSFPGYEGKKVKVSVYSAGDTVELLLNGRVLDRKPCGRAVKFIQEFEVEYQPGELTAVAYENNKEIGRASLATADKPENILLYPENDINNEDNIVYVEILVADSNNRLVPYAENEISVTVEGGRLLGLGSGKPDGSQNYKQSKGPAWQGRIMAVIQRDSSSNTVTVRATGEGLKDGVLVLK